MARGRQLSTRDCSVLTSSPTGFVEPSAVSMNLIYPFPRRSSDCALGTPNHGPGRGGFGGVAWAEGSGRGGHDLSGQPAALPPYSGASDEPDERHRLAPIPP